MTNDTISVTKTHYSFEEFISIISRLRAPDGCPWDREQTHESLKTCMIEEAYEVLEGIDRYNKTKNADNLCEELGDVLLQVAMHSEIAKEEGAFTIDDVIDGVAAKMIRRHPHVFGEEKAEDAQKALISWEAVKKAEKKDEPEKNILAEVPHSFPALYRAQKVLKKAQGLETEEPIPDALQKLQKIRTALDGLEAVLRDTETGDGKNKSFPEDKEHILENLGNMLFWGAGLARDFDENAEITLTNAIEKFINNTRV